MFRTVAVALFVLLAMVAGPPAHAAGPSIWTVAGSGLVTDLGDGGSATKAGLIRPYGVDVGADGALLIADWGANRIRRVSTDGTITGATAPLAGPVDVSATTGGGFLVAEWSGHRILHVARDGTVTTAAGNGIAAFAGDGGPAAAASLSYPSGVAAQPDGGFLIADWLNQRVRRVAPDGTISTVAGTGVEGFSGDGGPAAEARLDDPLAVAALPDGGFLITDHDNGRVRRVGPNGVITTVATGLDHPVGLDAAPDGSFLIADRYRHRILRVAADGTRTSAAGRGTMGFGGDGGEATAALLAYPSDVAVLPSGGFVIADESNHRVRMVTAAEPPLPPATDPALVAELLWPAPVSARGDRLVWSQYDPGLRRYVLMTRGGGVTSRVPVRARRAPFDADLGVSPTGHVVVAYSRCATDPPFNPYRLPSYRQGRRCIAYAFDFTMRREARLHAAGFLPSVAGDRIAFARPRGSGSDVFLRSPGGRLRRVARSVPALTRIDLAGRRLAFGGARRRGLPAVWLSTSGRAPRRVSPRGSFSWPSLYGDRLYYVGRGSLWRHNLATGRRESAPLVREPTTVAVGGGARAFVLARGGAGWQLRVAEDLAFVGG
jgi:NHL repeat